MSRHGLIDAENTSDFLPSHPQQFRKGAFVGEPPLRRAISWRIRQPSLPTRKRLVAQRRRWERACKRAAAASVTFCERGGMTECMRKARSKTGLFEWSAVHSDVAETVGFEPTCLSLDKTISSRSRYDHFDTSPSFAYSLYQNPRERSRHLSRFWGENPCLGLLAVLPDSRDWRYNGTR